MIDPKTQQPILKLKPGPNDANLRGDIFGGWLMSQIDIAGGITATKETKGMTVTRAVKDLTFIKPLFVYDLVSFFTEVLDVGKTSITIKVEVYAERYSNLLNPAAGPEEIDKISDATLVYVAVNKPGEKRIIAK
jgi:acyl-CoA thioesterase YciA